jgi:phosphosulfolactate synthase
MINLPTRTKKKRVNGLTSLHDVSLTTYELESILTDYSDFIDIAKFGVGTALVTPNLKQKIKLYKDYNVIPYFGGTLFEKFYGKNKLESYLNFLNENDINHIEVSTGTIDIPLEERVELVKTLSQNFIVFTEVGSKDDTKITPPSVWIKEINELHSAGAEYVITEGRNSGTAGIYRSTGELRTGLIEDIISNCDDSKIIFEAPTPKSQMYFINKLGSNVNLGNVNPNDVLLLETQRMGLRSETFDVV